MALVVTLALHWAGLWSHIPSNSRTTLTAVATGTSRASVQTPENLQPIGPLPIQSGNQAVAIPATAAYAIDTATGTVLYSKNSSAALPIASVTKIVTALVILSKHSPGDIVTVHKMPTYQTEDEVIGIQSGDTYKLGNLIGAALIPSANDAADALALYDAGTIPKFAAEMNAKMKEWGIAGTHFSNPTGLVDTGNYVTAIALAKIANLAIQNPFILRTIQQSQVTLTTTSGRTMTMATTDDLLASGQFYGIKTGYTLAAGECFVGLTRISGHQVITVVLGANDRFGATETLTDWIGRNWQWL